MSPAVVEAEPTERAAWSGTGQPAPVDAPTQAFGHYAEDVIPMGDALETPKRRFGKFGDGSITFEPGADEPGIEKKSDPPVPGPQGEYPTPLLEPRKERPDPGREFFPEQREEARKKAEAAEAARAERQRIKDKEAAERWKQRGDELRKELDIQPKVEPKGDYPEPPSDTRTA